MVKQMLRLALKTAGVMALLTAIAVPSAGAATQKNSRLQNLRLQKK